jgi:hypothetical protein
MPRIESALDRLNFGERKRSSDARLRELILYIADRCLTDPGFGAIKLNKLLYFSDFWSYARRGKAITGVEYMGQPQGPVPRRLLPVREEMVEKGEISIREAPIGRFTQQRIVALREPDLDKLFSPRDIALVDEVIEMFWGKTAKQMSEASHARIWRLAGTEKGAIPYQSVFISEENADAHDAVRLRRLREKHGHKVPAATRVR